MRDVARESEAHLFAGHQYDVSTTRLWYIRGYRISAGPGGRLTCRTFSGPDWSFLGQLGSRDGQRQQTSGPCR